MLLQKVSPMFDERFKELQRQIAETPVLEAIPVTSAQPAYPWCVRSEAHTFDLGRPTDTYLNYGPDAAESLRDWNDELQSCRELPRADMQDRVQRERTINKLNAEFTEAATKGAIAVVEGNVPPINPMDPAEMHMFIYNNIFFSIGFDGRETFAQLGGEEAAHVATTKDLEGVRILNQLDIDGLHTLGCVVVDYKGRRVVAQSIVPGIFRRQDESSIVYGSIDNGKTIASDPKFHELATLLAKHLHYTEHTVKDEEGKEYKLCTSLETKGLLGSDGRRYLLDLYRLFPVDIEFQEEECDEAKAKAKGLPPYPHRMTLLRPELVDLVWEHHFRTWMSEKVAKIQEEQKKKKEQEEKEKAEAKEEDGEVQELEAESRPEAKNSETKAEVAKPAEKTDEDDSKQVKIDVTEFQFNLNPDAFTPLSNLVQVDEAVERENANVREASQFLRKYCIASLVRDLITYQVTPVDGMALTNAMHRRGINMRYLGAILSKLDEFNNKSLNHIKELITQEMVVRASKHILRRLLKTTPARWSADCIAHFLNCLLGRNLNKAPKAEYQGKQPVAYAKLTPESLQEQLHEEIKLRFRYNVPCFTDFIERELRKLPTLREIALRVGIQIVARDYNFGSPDSVKPGKQKQSQSTTFTAQDIVNILPVVKEAPFRSHFADEAFEAGKVSLGQCKLHIMI
jgi:protein TIF31